MTQKVTVDGVSYDLPRTNDQSWGEVQTDWAVAISNRVDHLGFVGSTGPGVYGVTGPQGSTGLPGMKDLKDLKVLLV